MKGREMTVTVKVKTQFTSALTQGRVWECGRIVPDVPIDVATKWATAGLVDFVDNIAQLELNPEKPSLDQQIMDEIPGLKIENILLTIDEIREIRARAEEELSRRLEMSEKERQYYVIEQVEKANDERAAEEAERVFALEQIEEAHLREVAEKGAKK